MSLEHVAHPFDDAAYRRDRTHDAATLPSTYYDPDDDIGLGDIWDAVAEKLAAAGLDAQRFLGAPLGDARFDRDEEGGYLQSAEDVRKNLELLRAHLAESDELDEHLAALEEMLAVASDEGQGLFVALR